MKFLCVKYPSLGFRANDKKFRFAGGIFNVENVEEPDRAAVLATLTKLASNPLSEVMVEADYNLPHECPTCFKRFQSQAALNGHKPAHKTEKDTAESSWKEAGAPLKDV